MNFSDNLRNLRKEKDYSQEYLAEKLSVTRQTISKWENATAMPDLKKLTEISDFFEVSIDKLLGTEFIDNNQDYIKANDIAEYQKAYADHLFAAALQSQAEHNMANLKIYKRTTTIFGLVIIILAIVFISVTNNLSNQIQAIRSSRPEVIYQEPEESNKEAPIEYKMLDYDKKSPNMIKIKFTYSPSSFSKNASVYITVPNSDGSVQKIEMAEENGSFTATQYVDVAYPAEAECYVYTDDGTNVTKESFYPDYFNEKSLQLNDIEYDKTGDYSYLLTFSEFVGWNSNEMFSSFKEAYIIAENAEGKCIYKKPLKIEEFKEENENGFDKKVTLPNINTKDDIAKRIYVKLIDESGVTYKIYATIIQSETDITTQQTVIEFPNGKTIGNVE